MYRKLAFFVIALLFSFHPAFLPEQGMAMPKAPSLSQTPAVTGTVVETKNASGYTYMLVLSEGKKTWVAIPATSVEEGATVSYYEGMVMQNFTSKTLNRTFETIVFSPGIVGQKEDVATKPTANDSFSAAVNAEKKTSTPAAPTTMSAGSAGAIAPLEDVSIEKSTASNGYTVKEIFEKAKELAGQKVQVRGKVVKFSPMIMGKNWIHLQDGTGNPMQNSHDLVVTTGETVEVNDIITVEGQLAAEKDFGAGYKYAAIIEDASIIK